jgi:hypothetical protein
MKFTHIIYNFNLNLACYVPCLRVYLFLNLINDIRYSSLFILCSIVLNLFTLVCNTVFVKAIPVALFLNPIL